MPDAIIETNDGRYFRLLRGGTDVAYLAVRVMRAADGFRNAAFKTKAAPRLIRRAGCRAVAVDAVAEYAARDLRAVAGSGAEFNAAKFHRWLADHAEALAAFPELRERFGNVARAQEQLDQVRAQRAKIEERAPIKPGQSGADTMGQHVVSGPRGGKAIDAYMRHTGAATSGRWMCAPWSTG